VGARAHLARAIVAAGGPEKLAEFVRKGARASNGIRGAALRRHDKGSPALERAYRAIKEICPEGVPEQTVEPNANLCRRVGKKLKQAGLLGLSE
jgi:hypothetical protein